MIELEEKANNEETCCTLTAAGFVEKLFDLWGKEHVVARILKAARNIANNETHWLECKATIAQPKKFIERYKDSIWRVDKCKYCFGDYVLNVIKAVCALLNNRTGGILLLGVCDDGNPADVERLCNDSKSSPRFDEAVEAWDTDRWMNWLQLILDGGAGGGWVDRYGCNWHCSISLRKTSLLSVRVAIHRGRPVLLLVAKPSERPVYLTQECCPGMCNAGNFRNCPDGKDLERFRWCGYPHDKPQEPAKCYHVYKRQDGTQAAIAEWQIDELTAYWQDRSSDAKSFSTILRNEDETFQRIGGESVFGVLKTLRNKTLKKIAIRLRETVPMLFSTSKLLISTRRGHVLTIKNTSPNELVAETLLRGVANSLLYNDGTEPIPVVLEIDSLSIAAQRNLMENPATFIRNLLADTYERRLIASQMWDRILRGGLVHIVLVVPEESVCGYSSILSALKNSLRYFLSDYDVRVMSNDVISLQ